MDDYCNREILERLGADHLGDSYAAYELDWLLALEVQKPLGYNHRSLRVPIKCWHGMDDTITPLGAAMWMQREMDSFLLFAVEGATHNIHLDLAIVKAVFADICAENLLSEAKVELQKQAQESTNSGDTSDATEIPVEESLEIDTKTPYEESNLSDQMTAVDQSIPGLEVEKAWE
jgi:hypothetical protein